LVWEKIFKFNVTIPSWRCIDFGKGGILSLQSDAEVQTTNDGEQEYNDNDNTENNGNDDNDNENNRNPGGDDNGKGGHDGDDDKQKQYDHDNENNEKENIDEERMELSESHHSSYVHPLLKNYKNLKKTFFSTCNWLTLRKK